MEQSFPHLVSERLTLRRVVAEDAPVVLAGYSNPEVYRHMSVEYHSIEEVQVQLDWYESLWKGSLGTWWGICLNEDGTMIGNGGFHLWHQEHKSAELGYWILPKHQRQGYASEAIRLMCHHAFTQMGLHRIEAVVEVDNQASGSLLNKNGFTLEGTRRECEWKNNTFIDLQIWSRLSYEAIP